MGERRMYVRLPSKLTTSYKLADDQKSVADGPVPSLTKDVSGGGIRLATAIQFAPKTQLEVEVKFPDRATPVKFTAEVVWSQPLVQAEGFDRTRRFETGLRFVRIPAKDQKYVLQHAILNSPPSAH